MLKNPDAPVRKIVVTESPIDALSHKQLHKEPETTMYLSTCGNLTAEMKGNLTDILQKAKENGQSVVLAFDKDAAGQKLAEQVRSLEKSNSAAHVVYPTKGKDWNEMLEGNLSKGEKEVLNQLRRSIAISGNGHQFNHANDSNVLGLKMDM